ncbi:MAG: DHH family phosphoesterase [Methanomassiliicoccaceae archaeon]|nr:DHH family phosphoesterase [Methanomassiliicoccaceae archaeon]
MDDNVPPKLFSCLSFAANVVREHDNVRIFSHHDADGISAAIILARTMMRAGKGFELTLFSGLNSETMEEIKNCGAECIIISDMGASYIHELNEIDADVVVLDHHKGAGEPGKVNYVNPHSFGIDGMSGGCGASMAMLFSVAFDNNNWDLVQVAFAGIVGDKQHLKGLTGVNPYLFAEGNKRGYVTKEEGSLIPPGELMRSLFLSSEPYVRGVSGNAEGVAALLKDAGIDATRSSSDLNDAEKRKLSSLIAAKLLKQGVSREVMEEVACERYALRKWNMGAGTLASLLDSCGRSHNGGVGVGLGLGDRKCLSEAQNIDEAARRTVLSAFTEIDPCLEQMTNIQFFRNTESGFTGTMCEMAMRFTGGGKPTVGYTVMEKNTKASARCSHELLRMGVNLTEAMKKAGEAAGGGGGGHKVASGAWFPAGNEKLFLDSLDKIVGEQLSAK